MQNGGKKITSIKTYFCGYCVNDLCNAFENTNKELRQFPAAAVLFKYEDKDYYLFDTGYAARVFENGWRSRIYNYLNPIVYNSEDSLAGQLEKDGISADSIKGIIISHLHPDHIGGLCDFPTSKLFVSQKTYSTLKNPSLFDIIFTNLIPSDFENRVVVLNFTDEYDFFNNGSLILKDISGHTDGQTGMIFPEYNIFYAADSCWGMDLIDKHMKQFAKFLQHDFEAYQNTLDKIRRMKEDGMNIITSHEVYK